MDSGGAVSVQREASTEKKKTFLGRVPALGKRCVFLKGICRGEEENVSSADRKVSRFLARDDLTYGEEEKQGGRFKGRKKERLSREESDARKGGILIPKLWGEERGRLNRGGRREEGRAL